MTEHLFRKSSWEGLYSPEQLDQLLVVIKPKGWIAILTLFFLLAAVVGWSIFAKIPLQVSTQGIINTPDQFFTVKSLNEGSVVEIKVKKGDFIEVGQPLLVLSEQGTLKTVNSPVRGDIFRLDFNLQDFIKRGDSLLCISQALKEGQHIQAFGYLPVQYQGKISNGMPADIKVQEIYFKGKVINISPHSLSPSEILEGIPAIEWLTFLNPSKEPVLEVALAFDLMTPEAKERFSSLKPGNLCSIQITLAEERPIKFVVP